jgi:hypoxanthine phosphoribosyltransferase
VSLQLHDLTFSPFISEETIDRAIARIAQELKRDFNGKEPLFIGVLNGSFMFAADLLKKLDFPLHISFVKVASYEGTKSSGTVSELIGLKEDISGQTVVLLEDIIDTGNTLEELYEALQKKGVAKTKIATLLYKPKAYTKKIPIDYVGLEIPNDFVVGYGLDYDGLGRNLPAIYKLKE